MNKNSEFCNDILYSKFEQIKEKHQSKIQSLDEELTEHGYIHSFLNLCQEYSILICDMNDLFDEYNYCIPYELYEFFNQVSCQKYNLLFSYAEYVEGSGNLPSAFLKEAITDIELWSINTLLRLEKLNNYKKESPLRQLFSIEIYDTILQTQKDLCNCPGYALNEKKVSQSYASAAHNILFWLGKEVADKAHEYYQNAFELLDSSSASSEYNSYVYNSYYAMLYIFLHQYKSDIEEYGVDCDFDIDKKIYDCMHDNYRQAQERSRDIMIAHVNNLISRKCYSEAIQLAKEIIDICEERAKNIQACGTKLSLKNAYGLMLSIPELPEAEKSLTDDKLNNLLSTMSHEDYYCKDGDKEYPLKAY